MVFWVSVQISIRKCQKIAFSVILRHDLYGCQWDHMFFFFFITLPCPEHRNHNKRMWSTEHHKILSPDIQIFSRFQISRILLPATFLAPVAEKNFFWKLFCFDISNTLSKNKENLSQSVLDFAWFLLALKACISAIFYLIFISHQMVAFQKLWKIIISSKKLFSFPRSSNFCISIFPSFSPCQPLL